ncbi:MAG TPA: DUF488 domain-containing protein [Candidatus Paceibacterota bacterium]|nr:DUF488 domain-containing protein [Candidatus Paceibacterota bacterium]
MATTVYTIGHSTREAEEFAEILNAYGVQLLVDVRTVPKSRHVPQFNSDALERTLKEHDIAYLHMTELGGLRHTKKDSINLAWKNLSFRGYADYMQTPEFEKGVERLIKLAKDKTTAIMCAEAVPWRCHRSLIGDALLVRKIKVIDIMDREHSRPHELTSFARVKGKAIVYDKKPDC